MNQQTGTPPERGKKMRNKSDYDQTSFKSYWEPESDNRSAAQKMDDWLVAKRDEARENLICVLDFDGNSNPENQKKLEEAEKALQDFRKLNEAQKAVAWSEFQAAEKIRKEAKKAAQEKLYSEIKPISVADWLAELNKAARA